MIYNVDFIICYNDNTWSEESMKWSDGITKNCAGREKWEVEESRFFLTESDVKGIAKERWMKDFRVREKKDGPGMCHVSVANIKMIEERINEDQIKEKL